MFTSRRLALIAAAMSFAMLFGAYAFQLAGYVPCYLCLLQRPPHWLAAAVGLWVLLTRKAERASALIGAALMLISVGLSGYHAGVEFKIFEGPTTCAGVSVSPSISAQELLGKINAAPVVRCGDVTWSFLGVSMAGWNCVLSAVALALWCASVLKRRRVFA